MDDVIAEAAKRNLRAKHYERVTWEQEFRRQTQPKWIPYTKEYLATRADFIRRWNDLTAAGEQAEYLRWTNDYDGSHLEPVTELGYYEGEEFTETETEWQQRVNAEVNRRIKKDMNALHRILEDNE